MTGRKAQQARQAIGYSLGQAAKASGLSVERIRLFEQTGDAPWSVVVALAKAYHVEALDIVESKKPSACISTGGS